MKLPMSDSIGGVLRVVGLVGLLAIALSAHSCGGGGGGGPNDGSGIATTPTVPTVASEPDPALQPKSDMAGWAGRLTTELQAMGTALIAEPADIWSSLPTLNAAAVGIVAREDVDNTAALQQTLDSMQTGGTLVMGPGRYKHGGCITVRHRNIRILGNNTTLHATNPADMCIRIQGDGFVMTSMTLTAVTDKRLEGPEGSRLFVTGRRVRLVNNVVDGAASAAIWLFGASDFLVRGNQVRNTRADGIHCSDGAHHGRVVGNVIDNSFDDGISVVSYRKSVEAHDIMVDGNTVTSVPWGRGITAVGGVRILIQGNRVDAIVREAGILVSQEDYWQTFGPTQIVIIDNHITRVAAAPTSKAVPETGHASIEINTNNTDQGALAARYVLVDRNFISDSPTPGVRMLGQMCEIEVGANTFDKLRAAEVSFPVGVCGGNSPGCPSSSAASVGTSPVRYCPSTAVAR